MLTCPKCKRADRVCIIKDVFALCHRCHMAWDVHDKAKNGWVCPEHETDLLAYEFVAEGQIDIQLLCKKCNIYYVIPDQLKYKLQRAYVHEGEIE